MKKRKNYLDSRVIELYEQYETCGIVARELEISVSTVRNVLVRNGIPRTHRHKLTKHVRISNCRTKYCPALIAIAIDVLGMSTKDISECFAIPIQSVNNLLVKRHPDLKKKWRIYKSDVDMCAIRHDYINGVSTYEIERKYGVPHATISKWMNQEGYTRGKCTGLNKFVYTKECAECGRIFSSKSSNAKYCSRRCHNSAIYRRRYSTGHKARAEKYGVEYDSTITLKKLYKRDGGICQICGDLCDWGDTTWGSFGPNYPSIDHIVPFAKGGAHTWDNVQLAHHMCNSLKQDKLEVAV